MTRDSATVGEEYPPLHSDPALPPLIGDYDRTRERFRWAQARAELDGFPDGGLNIAHEAVDRHAAGPLADVVALRCLDRAGAATDLTYAELRRLTNRFAGALRALGCGPGERVCTLLTRTPELYVTALGTLKGGGVYCPLFPAFGPEPVRDRR